MNAEEFLATTHLRGMTLKIDVRTKEKLVEYVLLKGFGEFEKITSSSVVSFFDDAIYKALKEAIALIIRDRQLDNKTNP